MIAKRRLSDNCREGIITTYLKVRLVVGSGFLNTYPDHPGHLQTSTNALRIAGLLPGKRSFGAVQLLA